MKILNKHGIFFISVLIFAAVLFSGCAPREERNKIRTHFKGPEFIQIIAEKLENGTLKDSLPPEIEKALAERIKTATLKDVLPPTAVMVFGTFIPIFSVLAFFAFLIALLRLYHIRVMAMIEKGIERKPLNMKWELVFLFFGLVLTFAGPAVSIYMISMFGLAGWTVTGGIIPLFIGIAFLIFYRIYTNMKRNIAA